MSAWSRDTSVPVEAHGALAPPAERGDVAVQFDPVGLPVRAGNHEPRGIHARLRLTMRQASTTAASAATVYDTEAGTWPDAALRHEEPARHQHEQRGDGQPHRRPARAAAWRRARGRTAPTSTGRTGNRRSPCPRSRYRSVDKSRPVPRMLDYILARMIPVRDVIPSRTAPAVTLALLAAMAAALRLAGGPRVVAPVGRACGGAVALRRHPRGPLRARPLRGVRRRVCRRRARRAPWPPAARRTCSGPSAAPSPA